MAVQPKCLSCMFLNILQQRDERKLAELNLSKIKDITEQLEHEKTIATTLQQQLMTSQKEVARLSQELEEKRNHVECETKLSDLRQQVATLQHFVRQNNGSYTTIDKVEGLREEKERGRGCYGAVYEVQVDGVPCIAKRLHDILVGRGKEEEVDVEQRAAVISSFQRECVLLSGLRHPNVVQFMGVHCGSDEADISLIMEYMHMDLGDCIKRYPSIPLPYKTSILRDVAYGLAYLHSLNIIHRDLNAGNVLLTEFLRAKIADLGVAKLLERETAMIQTRTLCPGALDFMSPESLEESPKYDVRLDMFSFGHLTIYLVNQKPPHTFDSAVTVEDVQKKQMQVGKRRRALDQMGGSRHPLYSTVVQCLSDTPDQRPTSRVLVKRMEAICKQCPIPHENTLHMLAELGERKKFETDLRNELMVMSEEVVMIKREMAIKNRQLTDLREETATKDHQLAKLSQDLSQSHLHSQQLESRVRHLESELNTTSHTATKLSEEAVQLGAKLHSFAQSFDKVIMFMTYYKVKNKMHY